jgi:hypothetical protein
MCVHNVDKPVPNNLSKIPDDIRLEFSDNFEGLGLLPTEHKIRVDKSVTQVVHPPRRNPIA